MKRLHFLRVVLCVVATITVANLSAFDQPTQYRAPLFNENPSGKLESWVTSISAHVATGSTREAFDTHANKTPLFNAYGPFKLAHLGLGLEGLTAARPRTKAFWDVGGTFTDPAHLNNVANPGDAEFSGRFKANEIAVTLQQNLMWGLYVQLYLPVKDYTLDNISAKNVGTAQVNGQDMATFITGDFLTILAENGFVPYNQPFKKTCRGDVVVSAGWHGATEELEGIVTGLSGLMQLGAMVPTAFKRDENRVFSIPLGNDGHWGVVTRAAGELEVWNMLSLGVQAGSTMFFSKDRDIRMQTDRFKKQNGWIALEKGHAGVDKGSLWDIGAYAKAGGSLVQGLAVIVGYSYARQERSHLHVKDNNFLKTVIATQAALAKPNYVNQDDVVNADRRLRGWETHTVHAVLQYQPEMTISPLIKLEYACPVFGKYSWTTDMFTGTLGVAFEWGF